MIEDVIVTGRPTLDGGLHDAQSKENRHSHSNFIIRLMVSIDVRGRCAGGKPGFTPALSTQHLVLLLFVLS